ncbi:MAG: hypothetical protein ABW189_05355 [Rickettsiales bacterium]
MTETLLSLPAHDGKTIYGVLRRPAHAPCRKVALHFHGLTGNKDGYLEILSGNVAALRGYDHFRMGFYDRAPNARRLDGVTLADHVRDFRAVINYFAPLYDAIYVSAHSFAGLVALIDGMKGVKAASLWDPATDVTHFWKTTKSLAPASGGKKYRLDYGRVFILSAPFIDEIARYPDAACMELAKKVAPPTQVIVPEKSIFAASPHADPARYAALLPGNIPLKTIPGADHIFSGEGAADALLNACYDMFDAHG